MELKRKVAPLVGIRALRCLNAFSALLLGMKMLPAYGHMSFEDFFEMIEVMEREDQIKIFENGAKIVALDPEEVKAMVCFCSDKNGIPYREENIKTLKPNELVEVIVTVCMEMIHNIHVDLVTKDEKKNSNPSLLTSDVPS